MLRAPVPHGKELQGKVLQCLVAWHSERYRSKAVQSFFLHCLICLSCRVLM